MRRTILGHASSTVESLLNSCLQGIKGLQAGSSQDLCLLLKDLSAHGCFTGVPVQPKDRSRSRRKKSAHTHASRSITEAEEKNSAQHRKQVRRITKTTCGPHLLPSSKQCKQGSNARQDAEKNARLQKQRYKRNNATSSPNLLQCQQQRRKHHQHGRARWSHLLRQHQTVLPRSWFCERRRSNVSALRTA